MVVALLRSIAKAGVRDIGMIVGHGREQVEKVVRAALKNDEFTSLKIEFLIQAEQKGTGHAVRSAMDTAWGRERVSKNTPILVLPGDSPLVPAELITAMVAPLEKGAPLRLLTCELPDPKGYGRIVRAGGKSSGKVLKIVEEKDASPKEKKIHEVAVSIYLFDGKFLGASLPKLNTKNAQGEYYLTDLIAIGAKGKKVSTLLWGNPEDVRGVNDLWELSLVERTLGLRIIEAHARNGVRFLDPWSVLIESSVRIGEGVRIHRGVVLRGDTLIGNRVDIGSNTVLRSVRVGDDVELKAGCYCQDSVIGARAKVGPYAHLRPESFVGSDSKIGNFVELKKTTIGEKSSVAHLSYLGDAKVGDRVNIGCGFVTCNFDGRVIDGSRKHVTVIGDDCFIGSDCQAVAPVEIGHGAYIASGSTITRDVEPEALAIARARQENKPGYAKKLKG